MDKTPRFVLVRNPLETKHVHIRFVYCGARHYLCPILIHWYIFTLLTSQVIEKLLNTDQTNQTNYYKLFLVPSDLTIQSSTKYNTFLEYFISVVYPGYISNSYRSPYN